MEPLGLALSRAILYKAPTGYQYIYLRYNMKFQTSGTLFRISSRDDTWHDPKTFADIEMTSYGVIGASVNGETETPGTRQVRGTKRNLNP